MNRKYSVKLSPSGIDELTKAVEEYKKWLKLRTEKLLRRLADMGYQIASSKFAGATYDGINDSFVTIESRGENIRAVVALGTAVLFIEFGTGVTYPDDHPEAAQNGMVRGGYGHGLGKKPTWNYTGFPGTNGIIEDISASGMRIKTQGNPANKPMYDAAKQLREDLPRLVEEVFS